MPRRCLPLSLLALTFLALPAAQLFAQGKVQPTKLNTGRTALDEYVAAADESFEWKVVHKQEQNGLTGFIIDLTSQTWRSEDDVDRPTWKHWLSVVVPQEVKTDTALMFIGGGSNGREPSSPDGRMLQLAAATKSVVATLGTIPNQPLIFHGDGKKRGEDDLIGYTWDQFLKTGDQRWPAQLPMTKSVIRAMDAVQALSTQDDFGAQPVKDFVVTGGSKRGWTTWLVGITDERVKAIAPIVIDVLNANVSMQHHYSAYGFWAPAIGDYVHHKITHRRFEPRYAELLQLVDPFAYRDRLDMPKCIINATGDQFFLPDSSQFYYDDLLGEKHLCYVPNADHSLRDSNAFDTLASFFHCIAYDQARPEFTWDYPAEDTIRVTAKTTPQRVLLWRADNPETRDFRVDTIGRAFRSTELKRQADGTYTAKLPTPDKGWSAYVVQLEFNVNAPTPMRLSTNVQVLPKTLPFADKVAPVLESATTP